MAPKKRRTPNSNIGKRKMPSRKIKIPARKSSADFELENNAKDNNAEMEIATESNDRKLANCETSTFELANDATKEFDTSKKIDPTTIQSSSSNKLHDQLPKSSSSSCDLKSIIDAVNKLQIGPFVKIYPIQTEGKGLSAAAMSQNGSHLAFSFPDSNEFHLCARKSLSHDIARDDIRSTWLNFQSAKNRLTKVQISEKEKAESLSSPQNYVISHDDVSGLCFSVDDNYLLSCSLDGSVKVIGTTTYSVLEQYHGHGSITDIDVNSRTTKFMTVGVLSWDPFHTIHLYDFERKTPVRYFSGHTSSVKCVRFHPNGFYAATASSDKSIKLWSVDEAKEVRCFKDEDHPNKIAFSPDGKYLASTHGRCVKIWDIATEKELKCLETSNSEPHNLNVCYNLGRNMLATGGSDKKIHIWNIMGDEKSEAILGYSLLKSENLGKRIFSMKFDGIVLSCLTG